MKIAIINGPNLNLLGKRQPEVYGHETFAQTLSLLSEKFPETELFYMQNNSEGEIIDLIQDINCQPDFLGIVLNPGAYAHYSYAIADAVADSGLPVVEVHISNIHAREEFRSRSVTAARARAIISGCGRMGYELAIRYLLNSKL